MSFVLHRGKTKFMWFGVTTSTAITSGALVTFTSGLLVAATSSTAAVDVIGVIRHTIASTDSDYATARLVEVQVPVEKNTVWRADVSSGLVATDVGTEVDLTDSLNVNRAASSIKVVKVVRVVTTTLGHFFLKQNGSY